MIVIDCYGEAAFGGRTSDTFVLEDFDNLEQLKQYIENKQPLMCKEPTRLHKWTIIEKEGLRDRIVYLNNYLKIKNSWHYVMSREEIDVLKDSVCKGCSYNNDSLTSALSCHYSKGENGECKNYEGMFSFREWLRSKFK